MVKTTANIYASFSSGCPNIEKSSSLMSPEVREESESFTAKLLHLIWVQSIR